MWLAIMVFATNVRVRNLMNLGKRQEQTMAYLENHQLYYKKTCPYCMKVLNFMDENKVTLDLRDTTQSGNEEDLVRIGGKKQVPCLIIDGKPLYESDDIIAYLSTATITDIDE